MAPVMIVSHHKILNKPQELKEAVKAMQLSLLYKTKEAFLYFEHFTGFTSDI